MAFPRISIASVAAIRHGGTPSKARPDFWTGNIPWVSPKDMGAPIIRDTADHISEDAIAHSATNVIPDRSVLVVARSGVLAHSVPIAVTDVPVAFNQDIKALIPDQTKVVPEYLAYFLRASQAEILTRGVKKGATVHSLRSGFIESLHIPLPSLSEQRRVTDRLSRAEGVIRLQRQVADLAREIIPAAFIDLFGNPATNPRKWRIQMIGDSGATIRYGVGQPLPEKAGGLPFLRATNVKRGEISREGLVLVDPAANPIQRNPPLKRVDILVVRSGAYTGDVAQVGAEFEGAIAGYDLVLRPGDNHLAEFVSEYLLLPHVQQRYISAHKIRAAQPHLNATQLGSIPIPVPPLHLQRMFADRVNDIRGILAQLDMSGRTGESLFQALLARAFSG